MAADRRSREQAADAGKRPRLSVEYNLEKDPLQTGREEPEVSLRTRFALAPKGWDLTKWSWATLVVWLLGLLVLTAVVAELVGVGFIRLWLNRLPEG